MLEKKNDFNIGSSIINLRVLDKKENLQVIYFNMHDDEKTSVKAGEAIIEKYGGRLIELLAQGERLISFDLNERKYRFDPNRIYTDAGIKKTLFENKNYSGEALCEIKKFSDKLIDIVIEGKPKLIVALHNNKDNFIDEYCRNVKDFFVNPSKSFYNFFFTTEADFFNYLKNKKFNVVLQNNEHVIDDGSLSVYCCKKKIPYINVEAEHGHLDEQIEMLEELQKIIKILYPDE